MSISRSILSVVLIFLIAYSSPAQTAAQIQEAKDKLSHMTPDQIQAKIQSLGLTMDQAQAKAAQYGVDLESYLKMSPGSSAGNTAGNTAPSTTTPTTTTVIVPQAGAGQPATTVITSPTSTQSLGAPTIPVVVDTTGVAASQPAVNVPAGTPQDLIGPGGLKYFGYQVFQNVPAAFEPAASGPVDPDYMIGTADVLRIDLWGQVEQRNELEVDDEGRIFIPTVGPVVVSGLTLEQAQKTIIKLMSESYKGLVTNPRTVWLSVTIARLQPKRVFIMGAVRAPGGYVVSTYATVFNSLFGTGGPTVNGSLRDVRLIRNGKVIAHVDLYSYLTGSDKVNDVRVQNNDIIFVPPRGKTVSITGEVRRPAIFELLPGEHLKKLLDFAGGILPTAYLEKIQVEHIVPFKDRTQGEGEREIKDVNFRGILNDGKDYPLADGDAVTLFPITEPARNFVTVDGSVYRPGRYQLEKVPMLRDLVIAADSLRPEAYLNRADITRMHPDSTLEVLHVDLGRAMANAPSDNIALDSLDAVKIYSIWEMAPHRTVSIRGHVLYPGTYPYADSLTLYDLIFKAGGLQDSIFRLQTFLPRADLIRLNPDGYTKRTIPFNLGSVLDTIPGANQILQPDDEVVIHSIDVAVVRDDTVQVKGRVKNPGKFLLTTNMTLRDAIYLAGGYTEDADELEAEIARVVPKGMGEDSLVYIRFAKLPDFTATLDRGHPQSEAERTAEFRLQRYDIIFVRPNPEFKLQQLVDIRGEVHHSGAYALKYPTERLSDLIERAGGVKKSAFLLGGQMMRDGERVNVDFERALKRPGTSYDIVLHDGDSVYVPKTPNAVRVLGEVNNPGILSYIEGDDMMDYIDRAGGETDSSNYALVHFPSGNVEKHGLGWFHGNPTIDDGSTIFVTKVPPPPPSTPGVDVGTTIKDTFAILASAVTVIYLASQIK
ncbi:MAG TPA: SLBB domain-containing protein [Bacteroidota bacterium]|nr:SLBB domain-containing protein [Bacteroidota bacterium]